MFLIVQEQIRLSGSLNNNSSNPNNSQHFPTKILANDKVVRKQCSLCYNENKKTKWVTTMCSSCNNIPLCVTTCFKNYHTVQN